MNFKSKYKFKEIVLEKLSIKHLNDISKYSKDSKFFRYLEYDKFSSKIETRKYLKKKIRANNFKNNFWWSIKLAKQNVVIGTFVVHDLNIIRKSCEISYGIGPKYQNKGYFKKILKNIIKILKKNKIVRIQAVTSQSNKPSILGLKKNGFKVEGILRKYYFSKKTKKNYNAVILSKV
jgi:[ribosomal protein S5]-alanine N-acetyltransferase